MQMKGFVCINKICNLIVETQTAITILKRPREMQERIFRDCDSSCKRIFKRKFKNFFSQINIRNTLFQFHISILILSPLEIRTEH